MRAPLLVSVVLLTACTTVTITVYRRAGAPEPQRNTGHQDVALPVTLPRAPLLNRFDLFATKDRPIPPELFEFQDYFKPSGTPQDGHRDRPPSWARPRSDELAVANRVREWLGRTRGAVTPAEKATSTSSPIMSFVHLTDAQIREARAKLLDERQSKGLDQVVDSFEHDFFQELHIDVMFEALVQTFNQTAKHASAGKSYWMMQPSFAIHTGDAVDAGLASEFDVFRSIMDSLRVYGAEDESGHAAEHPLPWLSAIGNHDVFTFGNFIPGDSIKTAALIDGARSELSRSPLWRFIAWVSQADWYLEPKIDLTECAGCSDRFLASRDLGAEFVQPFIAAHKDLEPDTLGDARTAYHGFDLELDSKGKPRGYYAFELPVEHGYVFRGIVLNTDDFGEVPLDQRGGEGGWLGTQQLQWLEQQLTRNLDGRLLMVFGHHPVHTVRFAGNRRLLGARLLQASAGGHLLAYVTGHTHQHAVQLVTCHSRSFGRSKHADELVRVCKQTWRGFWEVQTASVIGFPQEARMITLRKLSDGLGFLELMPVHHTFVLDGLTPFRRMLEQAERGAKRDHCRHASCVDGQVIRRDGAAGAVRLFVPLPPGRTGSPR